MNFFIRLLYCVAVMSVVFVAGCAKSLPVHEVSDRPKLPLYLVPPLLESKVQVLTEQEVLPLARALLPATQGMTSWVDMNFAISQSLKHVSAKPADRVALERPGLVMTYGEMTRVLTLLKTLLPRLDNEPELLATSFTWLRLGPDFSFTGYYEPTLPASPRQTVRFKHPLYKSPPELKQYKRNQKPYHTRYAIDTKGILRNRGLEIAWIESAVEGFILQIQGSGRLVYEDGTTRHVLYDNQNGHKYKSLGRVMIDQGLLPKEGMNMESIRNWLAAHPEQHERLLNTNPSYVFFKLAPENKEGSYGSMGRVLTPRVSVAVDQKMLPNGLLTFMSVPLPAPDGTYSQPFHGLMLPQDSGGAIKRNRVDLFFGNGSEARRVAGHLDNKGAVFVLLPKI